jgi:hypothetical protein
MEQKGGGESDMQNCGGGRGCGCGGAGGEEGEGGLIQRGGEVGAGSARTGSWAPQFKNMMRRRQGAGVNTGNYRSEKTMVTKEPALLIQNECCFLFKFFFFLSSLNCSAVKIYSN